MADAAEVLGSMYDAFQAVSSFFRPGESEAESSIGRMFGIGVHEVVQCGRCRKFTHQLQYRTFFHIVSRCALRAFAACVRAFCVLLARASAVV
jgi:hypothetical protein